jgi:hypothetical protein
MSQTQTQTRTYTAVDIERVLDCFAADLDMIAQSTGLMPWETVGKLASDVKEMAKAGYLAEANIVLYRADGGVERAAKYGVTTEAGSLRAQRPGNSLWQRAPGGSLAVVVDYTALWRSLSSQEQQAFKSRLRMQWTASAIDVSFPGLSGSRDRAYVSNGWGVVRTLFQ